MSYVEWVSEYVFSPEPPAFVKTVIDSQGYIADRTSEECDHCGPSGNVWKWRHNGNSECWLEIDGIGPWKSYDG